MGFLVMGKIKDVGKLPSDMLENKQTYKEHPMHNTVTSLEKNQHLKRDGVFPIKTDFFFKDLKHVFITLLNYSGLT